MGHIHGPDGMGGQRFGCLAAQIAREVQQLQLMRLDDLMDVGFAHALRCVQTVECVRHRTASGLLAHQGFDVQHLFHYPLGLGLADAHLPLVLRSRFAVGGRERSATMPECLPASLDLGEPKIHEQDEQDQAKQ